MPAQHQAERKRICCLCEYWQSGGIESFLYNILTRIDLTQLQVDVVAVCLGDSVFTQPLQERGIRFFELSGSLYRPIENGRRFRALLKERRWDLLHVNAFEGLALAYLRIAAEEGVPVRIAHSHNTARHKSLALPLKQAVHIWARERYTRDATDLWACSREAASFLFSGKELAKRGYTFIPNGIDTARFRFDPAVRDQVRGELGLTDSFVIGNVGRLCSQKNQEFLLDVFSALRRRKPESRLLLVGTGEDGARLRKKAALLDIADRVLFYGPSDRPERLMWAMDAFALPSRFEGLPVTGVEAQAAGLPCFFADTVTAECAFSELVRFLPLSASPDTWAEAMAEACCTGDRTLASSVAREAGFDVASVAVLLEERYLDK